jgi:predicted phage baseplate assembly protein
MSEVWWGKEASPRSRPRLARHSNQPELLVGERQAIVGEIRSRIASFTPDWSNLRADDAGVALVRLFSEELEPVCARLNRLPEKIFGEFLSLAGVQALPATPASVMLEFEVSAGARESALIPRGFQVGAPPAGGSGDLVIFETTRALFAAPATIAELHTQEGSRFQALDFKNASDAAPFLPFGKRPRPGRALWIGLAGEVEPGPTISLGLRVTAPPGAPPPVSAGGSAPLPVPTAPLLRWDVLDGGSFKAAEILVDETGGLIHSGIIELRLPRQWRPGRPDGLAGATPLRWLRLRIVNGRYAEDPRLSFVKLNLTRALAARTIRDEVLEPVVGGRNRRWRLSQTPILPGSLILEVEDGGGDVLLTAAQTEQARGLLEAEPEESAVAPNSSRWREVDDLALYHADDKVFVLDPGSGEVTFGDGVHGAALPAGFRHVHAVRYRAGGGRAGAVEAGAVSALLSSAPFVASAKNPLPAAGGEDRESRAETLRRGPQELRARGRAVTVADYGLLAARAQGAQVERAYALANFHPAFPGLPIPGVVAVFVVPPDRGEGPPTPDEETLRAVARYLTQEAAPAGVEVVAAAPRYRKIRVEAAVLAAEGANAGETIRRLADALDAYLHPLKGGEDGTGWPFGGTLRYPAVLRLLTKDGGVHAVRRLNFVVDGLRLPDCTDYAISADALFWPEGHRVIVLDPEEEL